MGTIWYGGKDPETLNNMADLAICLVLVAQSSF